MLVFVHTDYKSVDIIVAWPHLYNLCVCYCLTIVLLLYIYFQVARVPFIEIEIYYFISLLSFLFNVAISNHVLRLQSELENVNKSYYCITTLVSNEGLLVIYYIHLKLLYNDNIWITTRLNQHEYISISNSKTAVRKRFNVMRCHAKICYKLQISTQP